MPCHCGRHTHFGVGKLFFEEPSPNRRPFALSTATRHYAPDKKVEFTHLFLELSVNLSQHLVQGICTHFFSTLLEPLSQLELDARQLQIEKVLLDDNQELSFENTGLKLIILFPTVISPQSKAKLQIHYQVEDPKAGLYFIEPDEKYPNRPRQVWSQGQDEDSSYWFPCLDSPNQKLTTESLIWVDKGLFAYSNGNLIEVKENVQTKKVGYHWHLPNPHPYYLVTLVVGDFIEVKGEYKGKPVNYYVPPHLLEQGKRSFGRTIDIMHFFSQKIGVEYPYSRYGQIAVAEFIFGGMENTTATTQSDLTLHDERASLDFSSEPLVSHELAHQWFGNLLTCKTWADGWLNEGFATYFEALWREHDLGEQEFHYYMHQLAQNYFDEDENEYRRPIVTNNYEEPIDLFDSHLYEKGGLVLHTLRFTLGETLFWASIKQYVLDNQYQNVETIDLIRAIEKITGKNLTAFFQQWVYRGGHPEWTAKWDWNENEKLLEISIDQTQTIDEANPPFQFVIPVNVYYAPNSTPQEMHLKITKSSHQWFFQMETNPIFIEIDPRHWVLSKRKLEFSESYLMAQSSYSPYVMSRIDSLNELGKLASTQAINHLIKIMKEDSFWAVRGNAARFLAKTHSQKGLKTIIECLEIEKHPKARRLMVESLGEYKLNAQAENGLLTLADKDESYFVEAQACVSIGKIHHGDSGLHQLLEWLKSKPLGWNSVVQAGILEALGKFPQKYLPIIQPILTAWCESGKPIPARLSAISALGQIGKQRPEIAQELINYLYDPHFRIKMSAIKTLAKMGLPDAIPQLREINRQHPDGRIKREAKLAIAKLQQSSPDSLQDQIEALQLENQDLIQRLEKIETKFPKVYPSF